MLYTGVPGWAGWANARVAWRERGFIFVAPFSFFPFIPGFTMRQGCSSTLTPLKKLHPILGVYKLAWNSGRKILAVGKISHVGQNTI